MADKAISDLTAASSVGATDLFVLEQNNTAKKLTGQTLLTYLGALWESYGGIADVTQYYAVSDDDTTAPSTWYTTVQSMTATNRYLWSYMTVTYATAETQDTTPCIIGVWGDKGDTWYTHIKYSSAYPTQDSDMGDTPDAYVGIYAGSSAVAPEHYTDYDWYGWKGLKGDTGTSITSVTKTGSSGDVDTYTVRFSNNTSTTFTLTNGSSISTIAKTSTSGLIDTYTVTLTNGQTSTFTVTNAKSISSITMTSGNHAAGTTDVYQILFNDGDAASFSVYNGANGTGAVSTVAGIGVEGANGNVPLILTGNGAPTASTVGQTNQLYFDTSGSVLYICLGETGGTFNWAGAGVTVDAAMSTSSTNPIQNKVISAKVGTTALTTTATDCSNAINEHDVEIGDVSALTTTATNLAGAVNELDSDIGTLGSSKVSKTGDTMTGDLIGNGGTFQSNSTNITKDVPVDGLTTGDKGLVVADSNGDLIGYLKPSFTSNNREGMRFGVERVISDTIYYHGFYFYIDNSGNKTVSFSSGSGAAFLEAIGNQAVTSVTNASTVASAGSGFTLNSAKIYRWGRIVQLRLNVTKSSAVTTATSMTVATLKSGYRPVENCAASATSSTINFSYVGSGGAVVCYGTWAAGVDKTIYATYIVD